jgi:hypothetical protein
VQFKDAKFRRQVMLQMLIAFQNFELTTSKQSTKLTETQLQQLQQCRAKIMQIMSKISNERFMATINSALEREKYWIEWKNNRCQNAFQTKNDAIAEIEEAFNKKSHEAVKRRKQQQKAGDTSFMQLFDHPSQTDVEAFLRSQDKETNKYQVPSYQTYVADKIMEQADPSSSIDKAYRIVQNPIFQWKALRLTCRTHLSSVTLEKNYDLERIITEGSGQAKPPPPTPENETPTTTPIMELPPRKNSQDSTMSNEERTDLMESEERDQPSTNEHLDKKAEKKEEPSDSGRSSRDSNVRELRSSDRGDNNRDDHDRQADDNRGRKRRRLNNAKEESQHDEEPTHRRHDSGSRKRGHPDGDEEDHSRRPSGRSRKR